MDFAQVNYNKDRLCTRTYMSVLGILGVKTNCPHMLILNIFSAPPETNKLHMMTLSIFFFLAQHITSQEVHSNPNCKPSSMHSNIQKVSSTQTSHILRNKVL